jgi:hypothetical protein
MYKFSSSDFEEEALLLLLEQALMSAVDRQVSTVGLVSVKAD